MTHVVTEACIHCKYTDCVDICPVDCFREGPNFLTIEDGQRSANASNPYVRPKTGKQEQKSLGT